MFRVSRIDSPYHGNPEIACMGDEQPTQVTLFNDVTGKEETFQICWNTASHTPCELLQALALAGFTPNDWTTECPPI